MTEQTMTNAEAEGAILTLFGSAKYRDLAENYYTITTKGELARTGYRQFNALGTEERVVVIPVLALAEIFALHAPVALPHPEPATDA